MGNESTGIQLSLYWSLTCRSCELRMVCMNNTEHHMSTQEQIAKGLETIVENNTSGHDDPCGLYHDGDAIAKSSFNYAIGLALDSAIAALADIPADNQAYPDMLALIAEMRAMKIPKQQEKE